MLGLKLNHVNKRGHSSASILTNVDLIKQNLYRNKQLVFKKTYLKCRPQTVVYYIKAFICQIGYNFNKQFSLAASHGLLVIALIMHVNKYVHWGWWCKAASTIFMNNT